MGIDSQVCFHRGLFSSLSNRERAPQGLWSHWMALIRMCVVPNCSQPLSRPILWIVAVCATYWTHSTAVCLLMVGLRDTLRISMGFQYFIEISRFHRDFKISYGFKDLNEILQDLTKIS